MRNDGPLVFVANLAFSSLGDGAATRAGTVVVFAAIAFIGFRLLQKVNRRQASNTTRW